MGQLLRDGLDAQAARYGLNLRQTGPAQMPVILFDDDPELAKGNLFATEALKRGVFMHPWHNMFLSAAHSEADIEEALAVTDRGAARRARISSDEGAWPEARSGRRCGRRAWRRGAEPRRSGLPQLRAS